MAGRSKPARRVLEGRVRDVVDSGESVIETESGVVLVRGGMPGERVRVRIEEQRQGAQRGSLLEVLEASASRVVPVCKLAEQCGGCPLMALELDAQRALKAERLARALTNAGAPPGFAVQVENVGSSLGYRGRARLAFRRLAQRSLIGYRQHAGHQLVDVDVCVVLEPALQNALGSIRERLAPSLEGSGEIELAVRDDARVVAQIRCDAPVGAAMYAAAEALTREPTPFAGVTLRIGDGAPARFGEIERALVASDRGVLHAPAGAFAQANSEVNRRLSELVVELAEPDGARVIELYAGHGNFSVALAARARAFWAVEGDPAAADACRKNLATRGFAHARVFAQDVGKLRFEERAEVVVLDPPRAGAKPLADIVRAVRASRVVYVSCHMTTLARDLKALCALGFRVERAHLLDMFPHTAHVEAVVRLSLPFSES
jgi:23S rRNA (uracil1939-C5)-methyltransferase